MKHFSSFKDFIDFLNGGSKNGIYTSEYTQIYDKLQVCMDYDELVEYGHGELTDIAFENESSWKFTLTYTFPNGEDFTVEVEGD